MILHNIPNNSELVKVATTAASADVLLEGDLDALDVVSATLDQHIAVAIYSTLVLINTHSDCSCHYMSSF